MRLRWALMMMGLTSSLSGCVVVVSGSDTYEACSVDSDCADAFDSCQSVVVDGTNSGRICTTRCTSNLDCDLGAACGATDTGDFCLQTCTNDLDCTGTWQCGTTNICTPPPTGVIRGTATRHEKCSIDSDCLNSNDRCSLVQLGTASDRICTNTCTTASQCVTGETCGTVASGSFCLLNCNVNSDCAENWVCGGNNICVPPGSVVIGTSDTYDTCVSTADCFQTNDSCQLISLDGANPLSICTQTCSATSCAKGGICVDTDAGAFCLPGCANDTDCRAYTGWMCNQLSSAVDFACTPSIPLELYDECGSFGQCPATATSPNGSQVAVSCRPVSVDRSHTWNMCTVQNCTIGSCPMSLSGQMGQCLTYAGQVHCYEGCAIGQAVTGCAAGFVCVDSDVDNNKLPAPICVPQI